MSVRPRSIIWFERTQYSILGLGLINIALTWNLQMARVAAIGRGAGWLISTLVLSFAFLLFLMWLISYKASRVAKWVFVVMTGLGFPFLVATWRELALNGALSVTITLVQTTLSLVAIWLLFRSDTRDWFARRAPVDPEIFR